MPPREFEILGVLPLQVVADVVKRPAVEGVVVRQPYFNAHHKVHLLPAEVVGGAIGDIRFCGREALGILVAAAIHPTSRVIGFRTL